jgi:hypothetical protein
MEDKYSKITQKEIDIIKQYLDQWNNLFFRDIKYYDEGWSINLREKAIYPRYIVIFKPYNRIEYSIKSFEIHYNQEGKEYFKSLYFIDNIASIEQLIEEIKMIIYGKDIFESIKKENFTE